MSYMVKKAAGLHKFNSPKMGTIFIQGAERLYRSSETTNQRIQFDIEPYGRHLGTGGQVSIELWVYDQVVVS
ncbi:hypothetical protein Tco_0207815 [Tanacetum coccineum]